MALPPTGSGRGEGRRGTDHPNLVRLGCGALTGGIVKSIIAPIERLKILYETQTMYTPLHSLKYTSLPGSIRTVIRESGLRGFWLGNTANLLRVVPNSAIKFSTFDTYKKGLARALPDEKYYFVRTIAAAALSGASQVLVTYPLDLIRTRMAVITSYKGITHCIISTFKNEGIRGFYQGMPLSLVGVMPYVGISMTIYDACKKYLLQPDAGIVVKLLPGVVGSICASCITFPIDVVRRRLQLQGTNPTIPRHYKNGVDCAKQLLRKEGIKGLYRGVSLQIMRSVPSTSLQFITYDYLKKVFHVE